MSVHASRRGAAEIEFVMVLPIILFLLLGMIWAGAVAARNADVAVRARHDAWRRMDEAAPTPFDFEDTAAGRIVATAESPVRVSPAVDGTFVPRSQLVTYGGAWNHPAVDMDQTPNWRLQALALRGSPGNVVSDIQAAIATVSALPRSLKAAIQAAIRDELAEISSLLATLLPAFKEAGDSLATAKQQATSQALARIDEQISQTQARLDEAQRQLAALEADIRQAERDLVNATAEERTRLETTLQSLRRQARENGEFQKPLAQMLSFLEQERRLTAGQ